MANDKLKKLSTEELKSKIKSTKTLIGIFIPLILTLAYFTYRDYAAGGKMGDPNLVMFICTIGGLVSLFPILKSAQDELESRER